MLPNKRTRGRPKGTGLNDFAHLKAIADLIGSDPNLRPTTAIRQLGIQDPSVIRRLRDKFHACEAELMAELRAAAHDQIAELRQPEPASQMPAADEATTSRAPARAMALATPESVRVSQPLATLVRKPSAVAMPTADSAMQTVATSAVNRGAVKAKALEPPPAAKPVQPPQSLSRQRAPRAVPPPSETSLPEWLGVGLSIYAMSMEAQFAVVGTLFEWPPLAAALRTQVAFAELAVAAVRPGLACLDAQAAFKT